jgi:hypothetical protein
VIIGGPYKIGRAALRGYLIFSHGQRPRTLMFE